MNVANLGGQSFERVTALRQFERKIKTILTPKLKMEGVPFCFSGCFILDVFVGRREGWERVAFSSNLFSVYN